MPNFCNIPAEFPQQLHSCTISAAFLQNFRSIPAELPQHSCRISAAFLQDSRNIPAEFSQHSCRISATYHLSMTLAAYHSSKRTTSRLKFHRIMPKKKTGSHDDSTGRLCTKIFLKRAR